MAERDKRPKAQPDSILRMRISTRLFLSYVGVLLIAVVVAFIASEAVTPLMMRLHQRHQGPGMDMPGHPRSRPDSGITMMQDLTAEYQSVTQRSMLIGLVAGLLVAAASSMWLSRRITAPLRDMHDASERIAEGHYTERLDEDAPGEVGELAAAFNRMAGELEETEARRSSLIGNVAHEFRTPLTSLRGYIEGIADGHFKPDPDVMSACARQLSRLGSLIDDLSLLSRVEAGVEPVEPRSVELSSLFEQARADLAVRFEEKEVILEVDAGLGDLDAGPAVRPVRVYVDPDRTLQIIENLLANALRHTPQGGTVALSAHREQTDDRTTTVPVQADRDDVVSESGGRTANAGGRGPLHGTSTIITVADTGEGIPQHAAPHVFERFYRAETSRSRRTGETGAGIGLTVAKAFVEAQGGRIWIQETSSAGTVIRFSVPSL